MVERHGPQRHFYELGYADAQAAIQAEKQGLRKLRRRRVPHNYKLSYISGRLDAFEENSSEDE